MINDCINNRYIVLGKCLESIISLLNDENHVFMNFTTEQQELFDCHWEQ